ncbi:xylulokinase [Tabrizicola sp.]|uniref:xylulokinase n=1 Tax=Tabrizicola sp. TaxID=2005166 RepID=UPI002733A54D|nr:FGGY family carbohydrate kinase [Tabrizicola sp.]MDP3197209.1 FGGY family carbohydrate kinase [Tabrizicola sp.]
MAEGLTIGLDFGTSAVKAVAMDSQGRVHARATASYPTARPAPDRAEQDPRDWWDATITTCRAITREVGTQSIDSIGLSGQLNGLVLVDNGGAVIRPGLIWLDQRAGVETAALQTHHARRLVQTASSPISPIAVLPKLQWLNTHEPDAIARTARIFQVKDYILWRLTGCFATEPNEASATLMMDLEQRAWAPDLAGHAGDRLAPIIPSVAIAGRVLPAVAEETGLRRGTPVVPGSGDTGALAIGCGAFAPGTVAVTLGTAGHVVAAVPNRGMGLVAGLWRMAHVVPDRELWLGLIPAGGLSIAWLRELIEGFTGGQVSFADLERLVHRSRPGAEDLTFLPFLAGAGTPWNDATRKAAFAGLTTSHGSPDIVRAVYEGVAFNIRACIDAFAAAGVPIIRIHLAEGGARSAAWCQIIANALQRDVHVVAEGDTSAVGAAILARAGLGTADLAALIATCVRIERTHAPDPATAPAMAAAWQRFVTHAGTPA